MLLLFLCVYLHFFFDWTSYFLCANDKMSKILYLTLDLLKNL